MPVRVDKEGKVFTLLTKNTCYIMEVVNGKYLYHRYYGKKTKKPALYPINSARGFSPYDPDFEEEAPGASPDTALTEFAFFGNGDFRANSLKLRNSDGTCATNFVFTGYRRMHGRKPVGDLPFAEPGYKTTTLRIDMTDEYSHCQLHLFYTVYPEENIITRFFTLENQGSEAVKIEKAMSLCLDLPEAGKYDMISLPGAHSHERFEQRKPLFIGNQSVFSRRGATSHHFNPFIALCGHKTNEVKGDVYGFNLIWSGDFLSEVEVDQHSYARVQLGLGEENFGWLLEKGESFTSPEAVMTFTAKGLGEMSRNFHDFIRSYILPPDPYKERPVVLNTWEATFFDIDEEKLLDYARAAKNVGIDMLVMDDGWFGARDNDRKGLGDWYPNERKFKNGLASFVRRVKETGVKFGIWIEPEMVNPDSDLYREHPDWVLRAGDRPALLSRAQLVLDFCNPEVLEYLKESFSRTFAGVDIDYIKWDSNRHLCGVGSKTLPPERQDEVSFRHMMGVYELYRWFRKTYPNVMIENCSGGGGRYDIAMMKYSTQIWASDNTAPEAREFIQHGSTLAYPPCVMSCHVTNPGNVCEDPNELDFRFRVAINGMLGYEMDMPGASDEVKETVARQISEYKQYEHLIKEGDLYRLESPMTSPYYAFYFISKDKKEILFTFLQRHPCEEKTINFKFQAVRNRIYVEQKSGRAYSGVQLQTGLPLATKDPRSFTLYFKTRK